MTVALVSLSVPARLNTGAATDFGGLAGSSGPVGCGLVLAAAWRGDGARTGSPVGSEDGGAAAGLVATAVSAFSGEVAGGLPIRRSVACTVVLSGSPG